MNERGSLLIGLMISGVIITMLLLLVTFSLSRYTTSVNIPGIGKNSASNNNSAVSQVGGTPTQIVKQAETVKIQADLKALQTLMAAFYAEQGVYPSTLAELTSYSGVQVATTNIKYISCSDQSVVLYYDAEGYQGYVFNQGQITPTSESPPSC
ncbi:MAG: hypothetical protein WD187_03320 [Candidatus Woykebacteria bacterium]